MLIAKMRDDKGISFKLMNEATAENYLREVNNYLRTAAYRKNYPIHTTGNDAGKYIDLEFAYLAELSSIDMHLREILFDMCVDVEHALKVSLIRDIEDNSKENAYDIVNDFLTTYPRIKSGIAYKSGSAFTGGLIQKYFTLTSVSGNPQITNVDCPAWVLTELLSFADFISFSNFYYNKYGLSSKIIKYNIINPVRNLRNACGHNTCILFDLQPQVATKPNTTISKYISTIPTIGKRERQRKLSCRPLFEICCLLYAQKAYVSSNVRKRQINNLYNFVHGRMIANSDYFKSNLTISTTLDFLTKVVDASV